MLHFCNICVTHTYICRGIKNADTQKKNVVVSGKREMPEDMPEASLKMDSPHSDDSVFSRKSWTWLEYYKNPSLRLLKLNFMYSLPLDLCKYYYYIKTVHSLIVLTSVSQCLLTITTG